MITTRTPDLGHVPARSRQILARGNLISLEDAVYRMSGKPAEVFGISGRGEVAVGNFADMVVFNPDTVIDKADFENPMEPAAGIDAVFVNGQAVYRDGASTGARPGKALKRQSSAAY